MRIGDILRSICGFEPKSPEPSEAGAKSSCVQKIWDRVMKAAACVFSPIAKCFGWKAAVVDPKASQDPTLAKVHDAASGIKTISAPVDSTSPDPRLIPAPTDLLDPIISTETSELDDGVGPNSRYNPTKAVAASYEKLFNHLTPDTLPRGFISAAEGLLVRVERLRESTGDARLDAIIKSLKLLLTPEVILNGTQTIREKIVADGNCLYSSLSSALSAVSTELIRTPEELRALAVTYLRDHKDDEEIQLSLMNSIIDYKDARRRNLIEIEIPTEEAIVGFLLIGSEERNQAEEMLARSKKEVEDLEQLDVDGYLNLAGQLDFFASASEILALSKVLEMTILVQRTNTDEEIYRFPGGSDNRGFLRVGYNGRDHYDAVWALPEVNDPS